MGARIFAMGGGGFSMEPENPLLDDYLLSLVTGQNSPRVCFVPTASGDSEDYIQRFLTAFPAGRAEASVLHLFKREVRDLREFLLQQDIVYVGGGSTANLLAVWRAHGLDTAVADAYREGVLMAGVSAGMNCWFQASLTDSYNTNDCDPLTDGLALLAGSACPHYDGEPTRRRAYLRMVGKELPDGYAAYDGVGLLFNDGHLVETVSSRASGRGFRVQATADGSAEHPLRVRHLGR